MRISPGFSSRTLVFAAAFAGASLQGQVWAQAQERPDMIVVLDGSGSMWGQVGGRAKVEHAREALSTVLSELPEASNIGMMVYGHRVRGQCSDIEMMVPVGPAPAAVPAILDAAAGLNPRGMTPLVDSVLQASGMLRHTEQAATVILLTDGIETCGGDPCALGRRLADEGIDFTAHVIGFDLRQDEQRQVACLAHETGGLFLAASDAEGLATALSTVMAADPGPLAPAGARNLRLILRDTEGGGALTRRELLSVTFLPLDGTGEMPRLLDLVWESGPLSGTGMILPGRYSLIIERDTNGKTPIRLALPVGIPEGEGNHVLDLVLAARLDLDPQLFAGEAMPERNNRLPAARGQGWAEMTVHPLVGGAIDPGTNYGGINRQDVALPPGDYFIRGTLSQMLTRESLVHVPAGLTTHELFDFASGVLSISLRDAGGVPLDRYDVTLFDGSAEQPLLKVSGRDASGPLPFYLPAGNWRVLAEGRDARAEAVVGIAAGGQPFFLDLRAGETLSPTAMALLDGGAPPACIDIHSAAGCVATGVTPAAVAAHLGLTGDAASAVTAPRFTGTWATDDGMMVLREDGRRIWGEVHINGGIGLIWGELSPDGTVLRGAMDRSSSPRGAVEWVLAPEGDRLSGSWDHNIARMGTQITARRLSGGVPYMHLATGTDDDLRLTRQGAPWEGADSPAFAAFMEEVRGPDLSAGSKATPVPAALPAEAPSTETPPANPAPVPVGLDAATLPDLIPAGLDGFAALVRWDYIHPDGRPAASAVFADTASVYREGYIWLHADWCGPGCPAEILAVGGPDRDSVANPDERLLKGGLFPALDLSGQGILAFEGADSWNSDPALSVHVLKEPWSDAVRLGPDWENVTATHGPFPGEMAATADLTGWPLPGTSAPAPRGADAVTLPPIGAIELLPQGIYATALTRPGETPLEGIARLWEDQTLIDALAMQCFTGPTVIHPDGMIARRDQVTGRAAAAGIPYETHSFLRCGQSGPLVACEIYDGRPDDANLLSSGVFTATLAPGPQGSFALAATAEGAPSRLYRSCLGADGFLDESELAPDGKPMLDHIRAREDQAALHPVPAEAAAPAQVASTTTAPAPPTGWPEASGMVNGLALGFFAVEADWSDPMPSPGTQAFLDRCYDTPSIHLPNGLNAELELRETAAGPEYSVIYTASCRAGGTAPWPADCVSTDPNVADPTQASFSFSGRFEEIDAHRIRFVTPTTADTIGDDITFHACLRADGAGVDLARDPLGPALMRALHMLE